jgi:hypothetical protein
MRQPQLCSMPGRCPPYVWRFRLSCSVGSVVAEALGAVNALPRLKSCSQTVNEIPSVFVIDANGTIRAKEVEDKALDLVVDGLVNEAKAGESLQRR